MMIVNSYWINREHKYWCDDTHSKEFGIYGYHISLRKRETVQDSYERLEEISRLKGKEDQNTGNIEEEIMIGMDAIDNYEEGAADDLDKSTATNKASTTSTINCANKRDQPTPGQIYNKLTNSFQPLAEDISKHLELVTLLNGFIVKAHKLLCEAKLLEMKQSLLQLFQSTSASMIQQTQNVFTNEKIVAS